MYGRVQVMWDDVFGEPEGVRSADWAWRCSYNCFKSTRSFILSAQEQQL
jgi:hypothetical protein